MITKEAFIKEFTNSVKVAQAYDDDLRDQMRRGRVILTHDGPWDITTKSMYESPFDQSNGLNTRSRPVSLQGKN